MSLSFEWDARKSAVNRRKHGVSFEEATTVFGDRMAAIFDDDRHSANELREIMVGYSERSRLLIVSFLESAGVVRIISARKATKRERLNHEENKIRKASQEHGE